MEGKVWKILLKKEILSKWHNGNAPLKEATKKKRRSTVQRLDNQKFLRLHAGRALLSLWE